MDIILNDSFENKIKMQATKFGFASARITSPESIPYARKGLSNFLQNGFHGQMDWMAKRTNWRSSPKDLWPDAQSIMLFTDNYNPTNDVLDGLKKKDRGNISVYAHGHDYHDLMKKRLKKFGSWFVGETQASIKVFVDTAPVMEKPLAQMAGLGWQGKHTNLVSRTLGNWFFIGVIFTDLKMKLDEKEIDRCGVCTRCLDICPTSAFVRPYQLDARKCISYLTIEHKGPVDVDLRSKIGNRIYGCDDCLAICPWNKFAKAATELKYFSKKHLNLQPLQDLATLTDEQFRRKFSGSPVKRIGRNRFIRNILYAIGNSKQAKFKLTVNALLNDADFGVRDAASWALEKLKRFNE